MFSSETCGADQEVELQVYIRYIYLQLFFSLYQILKCNIMETFRFIMIQFLLTLLVLLTKKLTSSANCGTLSLFFISQSLLHVYQENNYQSQHLVP